MKLAVRVLVPLALVVLLVVFAAAMVVGFLVGPG
jgi:hypothetical protein